MKRLRLSGAMLGLTVLLGACTGEPGTPSATHSLTVKLDGVAGAPVTVTNTTTNTRVFSGTLEGSKTFGALKTGDVFRVEGGAVNGYVTPSAQSVTLDANKTVTLTYQGVASTGTVVNDSLIAGRIKGYTFQSAKVYLANAVGTSMSETGDISADQQVTFQLGAKPDASNFYSILPPDGDDCRFTGTNTANPEIATFTQLLALGDQGDILGTVVERIVSGGSAADAVVARIYSMAATTVKGTILCGNGFVINYDLRLTAGWNAVELVNRKPNVTLRNLNADARAALSFERAAEYVNVSFRDPSDLTLPAGQQATREVVLTQLGGISGEVTLETNVPGVRVTPSTVKLPSLSAAGLGSRSLRAFRAPAIKPQAVGTSLTFTAAENAPAYSGFLDVIVKKEGVEIGRGTLSGFRLTSPSVEVSLPQQASLNLARGETKDLTFRVYSQGFFSGSTTVTLADLPVGVTASSETVTLTESGSAEVTLRVSASSDAALGTVTVRVTGPRVRNTQGLPDILPLTVTPARIPLELDSLQSTAPAPGGLWAISPAMYNGGEPSFTLVRVQDGAVVQRETLTGRPTLLPTPDGDAMLVTEVTNRSTWSQEFTLTRLRPDGTRTSRLFNYQDGGQNFSQGAVDAHGNLWFLKDTSTVVTSAALARVNFEAGTVTVVDSTRPYLGHESLSVSPDGRTVYVLPYSDDSLYRVETDTSAVSAVTPDRKINFFETSAPDNNGNVYLSQHDGVVRISSSGATTLLPLTDSARILGLDRTTPETLWLSQANNVIKFDTVTGNRQTISIQSGWGNSIKGSPNISGGIWAITSESVYNPASGNVHGQYFVSFLK